MQQLQSEFWAHFTKEYLSTLQKRYKWIRPQRNMHVDDVVIIKERLTHPLDWPLGRIVKCAIQTIKLSLEKLIFIIVRIVKQYTVRPTN